MAINKAILMFMVRKEKLYYIANIRMPTERAHGIQIMEMCQAFANQNYDVELIVSNRKSTIKDDPFLFYDIKPNFVIKKVWSLNLLQFGKIGFQIQSLTFAKMVTLYLFFKKGIFYTRDELPAVLLTIIGKETSWEVHMGQKNIFVRILLVFHTKIIAISEGLKDVYVSIGVDPKHIHVAPDGADISRFDIDLSKEDARKQLGLPLYKKIILYKGSLIPWKGAGTLALAAEHVIHTDTQFVFIGGTEADVESFKKEFGHVQNISILGNRPRQETPIYQKAADILVIPNSAKEDISKLYTSPMKLFGYMAGGVPIVASDLPSLREILGEQDATFFTPDDPISLANALDKVLSNEPEARDGAKRSLIKVREYSWDKRAISILSFIKNKQS